MGDQESGLVKHMREMALAHEEAEQPWNNSKTPVAAWAVIVLQRPDWPLAGNTVTERRGHPMFLLFANSPAAAEKMAREHLAQLDETNSTGDFVFVTVRVMTAHVPECVLRPVAAELQPKQ